MIRQITMCLDGYVLLPIECLDDVKNLKIRVAVKPTSKEIFDVMFKQAKEGKINIIGENEMTAMNELIDKQEENNEKQ